MPNPELATDRDLLVAWMEQQLREHLNPTILEIEDESYLHAGHSGNKGGGHFNLVIESSAFAGLSRVQRHQLVFDILGSEVGYAIHALSLKLTVVP